MPQNNTTWQNWKHYQDTAVNQKRGGMYSPWINMLVGGPVGWVKQGTGEGGLGGKFGERKATLQLAEASDGEELYNYMTQEEHDALENMNENQVTQFLNNLRERMRTEGAEGRARQKAEQELADKAKKRELAQDDLIAKVTAFANEMNMPVSELLQRDEFAKALNQQSFQMGASQGLNTGAGVGGLSMVNAQDSQQRALLGYEFQRKQAGQQAMSNAFGMLGNQMMQAEDIARYNQGMNLQMQEAEAMRRQQEYMQGLGAAQGKAGMIGGLIGGIYGGPTGAAMGQNIGSNMGGQRYQSNNQYKPYKFAYPSSSRPSGGGLNTAKYGGNY